MNAIDKTLATDISLGHLLDTLAAFGDLPLVFRYDGQPVRPGYHVTEVKAGQFSALDCGANPEAWAEIFIQLWDVEEGNRTHMPSGKFAAIIRKISEHVQLDGSARLTFEVSDGVQPMQLYCASAPIVGDDVVHVELTPRAASCKPRDRWLAEQAQAAACCGSADPARCCG
ncbi:MULTISPECIES: DUF6428 family protein [Rhizobium]|uniref:Uncharacterized protein n=1 Tax=Rhizobium tropici TaxID=398 RepID=A0A6P1BYI9_RHITR|nr:MULTISPECIES: DUF6428 family protein [Rhizobium]AGB69931.1 hypothetical protein RTCIAT899_CH02570 [Rhizobium tropici CIAT 899]MBB4239676.1 hypothetical protein [Rhizobium tropici]MBB5590946.1 hypothetical protein [Rhizobium tropici]MBB6489845.1 hypothetical protein [Rhizobium tropici]NEV09660.1 hypothetical protein [Rhizobium tropici]